MNEIDKAYLQIEEKILDHEIYQTVKDYSKAQEKIRTYLEIGELLNNVNTKYGKEVIKEYSKRLTLKFGKKYTTSLLYKIKQFYSITKKLPTMSGKLTWSHWYEMLSIRDINKIKYYINQCEINNLDVRSLREKIRNKEYERLDDKTKKKLIENKETSITDFIKDPIVIRNNTNLDNVNEKVLKRLILEDIDHFLLELGSGFCYIGNEYKIKIGSRNNYIDLLLYNKKFRCYVVVELKVVELKKEHIGQIEAYMNYIDMHIKDTLDNKTIGIIICRENNKLVIKYASNPNIFSASYLFN